MMMLEFPLVRDMFDGAYCIRASFLILFAATLGCMAYCALCDPGQLKREDAKKLQQANGSSEIAQPKRCHKSWLYQLPIRRYDHYCRWVTNCIGLLNHREFIIMCTGLVLIGVCGTILDLFLVVTTARQGDQWVIVFFLCMHLTYSIILTALAAPILRLHIGFISRNELANEWKKNDFYVVTSIKTGKIVPVNDLSDDEFNDQFDLFEYDKSRNVYDKDITANCMNFWCTPRWAPGQLGEF